jgi:hypothetical protein
MAEVTNGPIKEDVSYTSLMSVVTQEGVMRTHADGVEERHEEEHLWRGGYFGDHGDIVSAPRGGHKVPRVTQVKLPS